MEYRKLSDYEIRDLEFRILFEDNHLLAINKKAGEIVQGDKTGDECLADTLKAYIAGRDGKPGKVYIGVVHRLDRPVSGVCLFAKTSKALERLNAMLRNSELHKTYRALCCSRPASDEGHLEEWILRNEKQNKSYVVSAGRPDAKLAKLNYRYLRSTDRYHLREVELLTGRHHQIRCQLSHLGCPIKGDLKYGAPRSNPDGSICLHAWNLRFIHPVRKEEMNITCDAPWPDTRSDARSSQS